MAKTTEFPWDLLKAECLRTICTQLIQSTGASYSETRRKEDMIEFLGDVEVRGLEMAAKSLKPHSRTAQKSNETKTPSPAKRKSSRLEEEGEDEHGESTDGYNTRFKGVKRVKVRQDTPERQPKTPRRVGRPRKSEGDVFVSRSARESIGTLSVGPVKRGRGRPRKSFPEASGAGKTGGSADKEGPKDGEKENDEEPKRGRGRPRKSDAPTVQKNAAAKPGEPEKRGRGRPRKSVNGEEKSKQKSAAAPISNGKEVFDGVVMQKRMLSSKNDTLVPGDEDAEGDDDGEGEEDDTVLTNGRIHEGTSSLGGSNKENDPVEVFQQYTPDIENVADVDADGDPDPQAAPPPTATAA